jgi:hypothetical protein
VSAYATRADLYHFGLPRGLLASPGRLCDSGSASLNRLTLDQHGFEDGDAVTVRAEAGGSLPAPLVEGTTYYVKRVNDVAVQLAATSGGAAIDLTTDGDRIVLCPSSDAMVDAILEQNSRLLDSYLPAHAVPLDSPYPTVAVGIVAKLSAADALSVMGQASAQILASADQTRKELARLATGIPLRDSRATEQTNLATARQVTRSSGRGWDTTDGTLP